LRDKPKPGPGVKSACVIIGIAPDGRLGWQAISGRGRTGTDGLERITGEEMQRQIADIDDTTKKLVNKVAAAVAPSREKQ
jgi:hypothetical protein